MADSNLPEKVNQLRSFVHPDNKTMPPRVAAEVETRGERLLCADTVCRR